MWYSGREWKRGQLSQLLLDVCTSCQGILTLVLHGVRNPVQYELC